jgi:hypothetical protein
MGQIDAIFRRRARRLLMRFGVAGHVEIGSLGRYTQMTLRVWTIFLQAKL